MRACQDTSKFDTDSSCSIAVSCFCELISCLVVCNLLFQMPNLKTTSQADPLLIEAAGVLAMIAACKTFAFPFILETAGTPRLVANGAHAEHRWARAAGRRHKS